MNFFILDTFGDESLLKENKNLKRNHSNETPSKTNDLDELESEDSDVSSERDYGGLPPPSKDISHIVNKHLNNNSNSNKKKVQPPNFVDYKLSDIEFKLPEHNFQKGISADHRENAIGTLNSFETLSNLEVIGPNKAKMLRKIEREKSKGSNWFNIPATEITDEIKNDLKVLQMRSILNPKHFYKKNDMKVLPKYFQIGTVQHSPLEFYKEKHIRRNKNKTIVDELLVDDNVNKYTNRKYQEIIKKNYKHKKVVKKLKKLKK